MEVPNTDNAVIASTSSERDQIANYVKLRPPVGIVNRICIETVLAGHLVVAAFYWWLSPKGFPVDHCRFWLNSVFPLGVVLATSLGLTGMLRQRYKMPTLAVAGCAAAWLAIAVSGRLLFPISLGRLWAAGFLPASLSAGCFLVLARSALTPIYQWLPTSVIGALLGVFVIWVQVPPTPAIPALLEIPVAKSKDDAAQQHSPLVSIGQSYLFHSSMAELIVKCSGVTIRCSPLLTFDRVSPDGFWSILAPDTTTRRSLQRQTLVSGTHAFHYSDDSKITLPEPTIEGRVELEAFTVVNRDTFSHLNSYCVLDIAGYKQLSIAFSPCDQTPIDVLPADYPTGRPARFAYVDSSDTLSVVEATSGEKGPFRLLASGPLRRGEPLTITFFDEREQIASVTLKDWSSQVSTTLSPTAGWGVPVNAIEFQRLGSSETAPAKMWITLSATSVGRGWESVGHRAGTYRNRLVLDVNPL